MNDKFDSFWDRRHNITLRFTQDWINNEWARGRTSHVVFLIRLNRKKQLIRKLGLIRAALKHFSCLDFFSDDYLHITIKPIGFLENVKKHDDSYLESDLNKIVEAAREIFSSLKPFAVRLKRLNLFDDCLFVEVRDEGRLNDLNKKILEIPGIKKLPQRDYPNFVPHVSIAQFQNNIEINAMISAVEKYRNTNFGTIKIVQVELIILKLFKKHPRIESYAKFKLKNNN